MYKNILVPYDKSDHARHALTSAIELAENNPEAHITVLTVVAVPDINDAAYEAAARIAGVSTMSEEDSLKLQREYYAANKRVIEEDTEELVKGCNVAITYRVTSGRPHEAIAEYSEMEQNDLIVMGCRGLGAVMGMLGSVSYSILRTVDVPVLVVK